MSYTVKGRVKHVGDIETFDSGFQKRLVVLEVNDNGYTNDFAMEMVKDKATAAGELKVGQEIEANFNVRSNEHNGRYYTNLNCWKWNVLTSAPPTRPVMNEEPQF
jgi:hypothetical protein